MKSADTGSARNAVTTGNVADKQHTARAVEAAMTTMIDILGGNPKTEPKSNALWFFGGGIMPGAGKALSYAMERVAAKGIHEELFAGIGSFGCMVRASANKLKIDMENRKKIAKLQSKLEHVPKIDPEDPEHKKENPEYTELMKELTKLQMYVDKEQNVRIWDEKFKNEIMYRGNCVFGTHRGFNLADPEHPEWLEKAIGFCKEMNIRTIYLIGGDGTARQAAELAPKFEQHGIRFVYYLPGTIDGINGVPEGIGMESAVQHAATLTAIQAGTNLNTEDVPDELESCYSVCIVEFFGRNRNDPVAKYAKYLLDKMEKEKDFKSGAFSEGYQIGVGGIPFEDVDIYMIPAGIPVDIDRLMEKTLNSKRRTLIIISEGADITTDELVALFKGHRKVRTFVIGHQGQNAPLVEDEADKIKGAVGASIQVLADMVQFGEKQSKCLVFENGYYATPAVYPIGYFAERNPRNLKTSELPADLEEALRVFLP